MFRRWWPQYPEIRKTVLLCLFLFCLQLTAIPMAPWPWWVHVPGALIVDAVFGLLMGIRFLPPKLQLAIGAVVLGVHTVLLAVVYFAFTRSFPATVENADEKAFLLAGTVALACSLVIAGAAGLLGWRRYLAKQPE